MIRTSDSEYLSLYFYNIRKIYPRKLSSKSNKNMVELPCSIAHIYIASLPLCKVFLFLDAVLFGGK